MKNTYRVVSVHVLIKHPLKHNTEYTRIHYELRASFCINDEREDKI